jgi:multidrug efflux pump subunit AcrB
MVFALIGSLIVTLTLLPVLCAWFMRDGVRERRNAAFEAIKSVYTKGLDFCLAIRGAPRWPRPDSAGRFAAAHPAHRRRVHAATG